MSSFGLCANVDSSRRLRNHQAEGAVANHVRHFGFIKKATSKY